MALPPAGRRRSAPPLVGHFVGLLVGGPSVAQVMALTLPSPPSRAARGPVAPVRRPLVYRAA